MVLRLGSKIRFFLCLKKKEYTVTGSDNLVIAGGVTDISTVAQGVDTVNRVGRRIKWTSLECHLVITPQALTGSTTPYDSMMFAIVLDMQPNGTPPSFSAIFDTAATTSTTAYLACRNSAQNGKRFKVLKVERCSIQLAGPIIVNREFYLDLSKLNLTAEFAGTSTATANTNSIYAVYGDQFQQAASTAIGSTINFNTKLRFVDL